jgi:hypothetical protein
MLNGCNLCALYWLGRWFLVKTFDELEESDVEGYRNFRVGFGASVRL